MNNKSKPYNIHSKKWMDSIYVGYVGGSISPPAFTSYQSNRTKTKFISNNSQTDITTSSTSKITVSKFRYKNKNKKYYTVPEISSSDSNSNSEIDQTNSQTRFGMSQQQSSPSTCGNYNHNCCILTVGCIIFFILLICIIIGIIICITITTIR